MLKALKNRARAESSESTSIAASDELVRIPTTYHGSHAVVAPFGPKTCTSVAARLGGSKETWVGADIVVTYTGVYVVRTNDTEAIHCFGSGNVAFVSCDTLDNRLWSLVVTNKESDPVRSALKRDESECHVFHVGESNYRCEDLIDFVNRGTQGKYPGSLGVYYARYNGSVSVDQEKGNEVVNEAVKRLALLHVEPRPVEIVITSTQIRVIDAESADELKVFSIVEVSFTATLGKEGKKLSFITNDARFGLLYCHAFSVDCGRALEIPQTIGMAFEAATELIRTASKAELKELGLLQSNKGTSGALGVFEVKHVGSIPASQNNGNVVVEKALMTARRQTKMAEMVMLIISEDSIREIDGLTGEVNRSVLLSHVSFITTIGDKKDIFGFISEDPRLKRLLVHLYETTPNVALKIVKTINDAFKTLVDKRKQQKTGNPFKAVTKEREPAPGKLFKCQLHRRDIKPDKVIGAGQFGQVYLATFRDARVAVKTVRLAASDDDKEDFVHEAEVMLDLKNEGLVQLLGVAVQQRPWLCVIEFMKYGDLKDVLQTCKERDFEVSLWEQVHMLVQLADGLQFMASRRYIHMDIAARNCLIDVNNICKLADFGLTRMLDKGTNRYLLKKAAKLPVRWVAIESLETGVFTEASDVWAYGVLIWEVLSYGRIPYEAVANADVKAAVKKGTRLIQPPGSNDGLFGMAESCWNLQRSARPTFASLFKALDDMTDEAKSVSCAERDIGKAVTADESVDDSAGPTKAVPSAPTKTTAAATAPAERSLSSGPAPSNGL